MTMALAAKPRWLHSWLGGLSTRELVTRTVRATINDDVVTQAAAIAYYAFSALVPFLGVLITLAVSLLPNFASAESGNDSTAGQAVLQFQDALKGLLPTEAYQVVADQIARIQKQPPVGLLSISLVVSLYLASAVFQAVVAAMNQIYRVRETRPIWKRYLLALSMTVVQATILIGGLLAIVLGEPLTRWLRMSEAQAFLAIASQWIGVVLLVLLSFALVFHVAPNARQRWEWITPGSLLGTVAFILASLLFRLVAQHLSNYEKTYGALGGVMAMLFWLWLMGLILLVAAELNAVIREADCDREPELCGDTAPMKTPSKEKEAPANEAPAAHETPSPSRAGA